MCTLALAWEQACLHVYLSLRAQDVLLPALIAAAFLGFDMCGMLDVRLGCLHLGVQPDRLLTMLRLRVMLPSIHS